MGEMMNATILETDLRDDLDELAETITIACNRVRHAVKRDEQRAHSQRKGAKHNEDANES
jgi:hypothetical protein